MRSQRTARLLALTALLTAAAPAAAATPTRPPITMRAAHAAITQQAIADTPGFGARSARVGRCHRLSWRTIECWATFFDVTADDGENWDQAAVRYHARLAGRRIIATTPDYLPAR